MTADTSEDTQPFRHYTTKHRITAWLSQNLFDHITYTSRRGLTKGMKRKGGLGWVPAALLKQTITPEEEFWHKLDLRGLVVYDIGAFHGLLTLFFAQTARHVVSYEPNSANRRRLLENIRLNHLANVTVRDIGLAANAGSATMASSPLMPGGSTVEQTAVARVQQQDRSTVLEEIRLTTLDRDVAERQLPAPEFMKIDVEGLELDVLQGARQTLQSHRPALFLEMHGNSMAEKRRKVHEVVKFLNEAGYRTIRHVETGTGITPDNSAVSAMGHLYCPVPAEA